MLLGQALFCQTFQTIDIFSQDFKGVFNRLRAGHIHAGYLEDFHRRLGRATLSSIPMYLIRVNAFEFQSFTIRVMNQEELTIPFNFDCPRV